MVKTRVAALAYSMRSSKLRLAHTLPGCVCRRLSRAWASLSLELDTGDSEASTSWAASSGRCLSTHSGKGGKASMYLSCCTKPWAVSASKLTIAERAEAKAA